MSSQDKKKYFTFMLIPHSEGAVRRLRIPWVLIQVCTCLLAGVLICACYFYRDYGRVKSHLPELYQLRETNNRQKGEIETLADQAADLEERLSELDELELQVQELLQATSQQSPGEVALVASRGSGEDGTIMGLRRKSSLLARGGGGAGKEQGALIPLVAESLDNVEMQVDTYRENLEEMLTALEKRQDYLEAKPSIWPARGRITSRYGYRKSPFGSTREFHQGLDIAAPRGTPVLATGAGVVTYAQWRSGYGNTVIIDHGYGFRTFYGHNSSLKVKVGQRVSKGEVIAHMGSTGRSTGSHVHYEVHVNGKPQNPANYL
ncbi:MAG: M23 family metallopeptidase [Firmicutes bacterium]|nr:M23 family metallopeptidase [Bacillota bacterium]